MKTALSRMVKTSSLSRVPVRCQAIFFLALNDILAAKGKY